MTATTTEDGSRNSSLDKLNQKIMKYEMETPWMELHGKISKKRTKIVWAETPWGTRFTQLRGKRSSLPSATETTIRQKFRQAAAQRNLIMMDIEQLEPYRQAWRAKIQSGNTAYKTLRGYIFAEVYKTL